MIKETLVFSKDMDDFLNGINLEIKKGDRFDIDPKTNTIMTKAHGAQFYGTVFINATNVIDLGYAKRELAC